MKGSIYLIGGGEIKEGETTAIDNELKAITSAGDTLAFFATAASDSPGYIRTVESVFGNDLHVVAPTEKDGHEFALQAINSAAIIYLGGGSAKLLLDLFEKWNLVDPLRLALERGAHLVGISAGAQVLSTWYIHEDSHSQELQRGWGLVSTCVLVHASPDSSSRAEMLWRGSHGVNVNSFTSIEKCVALRVSASDIQRVGDGKIRRVQKD